jgi:ribosomal protein S6--L-glutamate ligase
MKVCLLAEPRPSPVLSSALRILAERHTVVACDPSTLVGGYANRPSQLHDVDLYLLKSRSTAARAHAEAARLTGSIVINTPDATSAALDRATMAARLEGAGIPAPRTWTMDRLSELAAVGWESWPVVVKSRRSRRGDLVTLVRDPDDLFALLPTWAQEPVIAQEFVPNDGFDLKFWVINDEVTVARRPGALNEHGAAQDVTLEPEDLPQKWISTVLAAGAALDLEIFGVDALITEDGPVIIDVNAFPGFRSAAGADHALADLVERRAAERRLCA